MKQKLKGGNGSPGRGGPPLAGMGKPQAPGVSPLKLNEMRSFKCTTKVSKVDDKEERVEIDEVGNINKVDAVPGGQIFCGSEHFEPVVVLKLVSALEKGNPTGKMALAPMMPPNGPFDWKCTQCGRIYTSREILGE